VAASLPTSPILVGHSMGGFVVQKFLETHLSPAAFLLASIPPDGARSMYARLMRNRPLDVLRANATLSLLPFISDPERAQRLLFSAAMSGEDVVRHHRLLEDESMLGALDCLALERVLPNEVRSPIHVMGAADDALLAGYEIEATARAYGTEALVFDNVAHDMMLDPNWRSVADSLIKRLDSQFGEARFEPHFGRIGKARLVGANALPA
jgi:pimeloyl-ACP methyl ester carboxylesterase